MWWNIQNKEMRLVKKKRCIKYIKKYKVAYITNEKSASTTIQYSLLDGESNHPHRVEQFDDYCDFKIPLFSIVRNPYSRILSSYKDKIGFGKDDNIWMPFCKKYKIKYKSCISFLKFLEILHQDKKRFYYDRHFRPQHFNLMNDFVVPEFIGRIEDMESVSNYLKKYNVKIIDWKMHFTNSSLSYFKEIKPNEARLISEIYKKDFETYRYSFDINNQSILPPIENIQSCNDKFLENI